ncbi:hypothetical protein D3C81_1577890 [compost metagenome]
MGHAGNIAVQANLAIFAEGELQFVAVVEELEHRLQLVVAVGAAAKDMQEQIELGRGWQGQALLHVKAPAGAVATP